MTRSGEELVQVQVYNRHSALLYDFVVDRDLIVFHLNQSQTDFTYHKGDNTSYIDYVFMSNYAMEAVINSDHLPAPSSSQLPGSNLEVMSTCSSHIARLYQVWMDR